MLQKQASGSVLDTLIFKAAGFAEGKLAGRVLPQLGTTAVCRCHHQLWCSAALYVLRVCTLDDFVSPPQPPGFLST